MIEQALYEHLTSQICLREHLATYDDVLAVFNQAAPSDTDEGWQNGTQYGRIVFSVDLQGDPERTMGGTLAVDILCKANEQAPEDIEPIVRSLIDGYFFSSGGFIAAAQWKNSSYFTEETNPVDGCTLAFELLAFPVLTTIDPDVIKRFNEWTADRYPDIHVINYNELPDSAWKPGCGQSAVYWRLVDDNPANWIPDTYQTIWRTANVRCHIFSQDNATAAAVGRMINTQLYTEKRLRKTGETQIMVNRRNSLNFGADPLRTGQLSVEATYGIIVSFQNTRTIEHISVNQNERT